MYRAKFVATVFAARQFVNHGHVRVNGKKVNIASYSVSEGDVIEVRDKSKQMAVRTPGLGDVPYPVVMEPNLVVEFYAKN